MIEFRQTFSALAGGLIVETVGFGWQQVSEPQPASIPHSESLEQPQQRPRDPPVQEPLFAEQNNFELSALQESLFPGVQQQIPQSPLAEGVDEEIVEPVALKQENGVAPKAPEQTDGWHFPGVV